MSGSKECGSTLFFFFSTLFYIFNLSTLRPFYLTVGCFEDNKKKNRETDSSPYAMRYNYE